MSTETGPAGLLDSVRALLASVVGLAHTRLELLGAELQEELARLGVILFAAIIALFFAFLGVAFAAIAVLIAVGEPHRLVAAVTLATLFLVLGALSAWWMRRVILARRRIFDASLSELRKDRDLLEPRP